MPRPQFTLRALLILMFGTYCFLGGVGFGSKREQPRLASELADAQAARKRADQELEELQATAAQFQESFSEWRARAGVQH